MPRTALVATRATDASIPVAEPVVVETLDNVVRLELDDGGLIDFDRRELLAALQADAA